MALLPVLPACSDTGATDGIEADAPRYWSLELNHHAVTLSLTAPYDTLTLLATARTDTGEPINGVPKPQYVSRIGERIVVTAEGTLRAVAPLPAGTYAVVVVSLTVGDRTHTDSVLVAVVDNSAPPELATLSIHPLPPDSAKVAVTNDGTLLFPVTLVPRMTDTGGAPLSDLLVAFRSSDTTIAKIHPTTGEINGRRPGRVTIYASATAYGHAKADTLPYQIGWPASRSVIVRDDGTNAFEPSEIRVGAGALVLWQRNCFENCSPIDVTFADVDLPNVAPAKIFGAASFTAAPFDFVCSIFDCESGGSIPPSAIGLRVFPAPGTYEYRSTLYGTHGRVVVVAEP